MVVHAVPSLPNAGAPGGRRNISKKQPPSLSINRLVACE
jgi:hypothetical protein